MSRIRDIANVLSTATSLATDTETAAAISSHNTAANGHIGRGNTASRPASPTVGDIYFDTTLAALIAYNSTGWVRVSQDPAPQIASISPTTTITAGTTITITGASFKTGLAVKFIGADATVYDSPLATFVGATTVTATTPALSVANEPYDVKVINSDNQFAILENALDAGGSPTWSTASGTIVTIGEQTALSTSVSATDPDGTSIVYSSSNLPAWITLNSSTGALTGTAPDVASDTTYSFNVTASDGLNTSSRAFNVIVNAIVSFNVDYLVVAGGGGGGYGGGLGGGGGAGGLLSTVDNTGGLGSLQTALTLNSATTYTVTVGNGGGGGTSATTSNAGQGGSSSISGTGITTVTATGGGGGGGSNLGANAAYLIGQDGGSSGGGGENGGGLGSAGTRTASPVQGFTGGVGNSSPTYGGGGGGGAGANGAGGIAAGGGVGGVGVLVSITGTATYYAGGGGGAPYTRAFGTCAGGNGGGGTGADANFSGSPASTAGETNKGGGGGARTSGNGAAGGSGVVILRSTRIAASTTGSPTYTTSGSNHIYKFTGTGSITY